MDIQQQRFELAIKEAFPNSPQYLNKNPDGTYRNTTTFGAWIGWKLAAKAQAVPENKQFNLDEFLAMEEKLKHKSGVITADLDRFIAYAEMVLEKAKAIKESK